jgi:YfiR/HmsC-like
MFKLSSCAHRDFRPLHLLGEVVLALFWLCSPLTAAKAAPELDEYQVKTVCLYNFARYTDWPSNAFSAPNDSLRLCILGEDPLGDRVKGLSDKEVKGHPVEVVHLQSNSKLEDLLKCHVLFTTEHQNPAFQKLINQPDQSVLTVTDLLGDAIVGFFISEGKVRFEIDLAQAENSHLKISSQLLKLAQIKGGAQ